MTTKVLILAAGHAVSVKIGSRDPVTVPAHAHREFWISRGQDAAITEIQSDETGGATPNAGGGGDGDHPPR